MFFKRTNKNKPDELSEKQSVKSAHPMEPARAAPAPLEASALRRTADPKKLGFKSTEELEPSAGLIGQDRALGAIDFGANIEAHDFNIFVLGPPASGKSTAVRTFLETLAAEAPPPPDWVYVNNFEDANKPRALELPAGRARPFAKAVVGALDELRATLPQNFEGEDYQARRRAIDEEFRLGQENALETLNKKANSQNIALLRTPMGFTMAPMHEGKVVKPDVFNQLPKKMREEVQQRIEDLQKELEKILSEAPKADKKRRTRIAALNEEVSRYVVAYALADVKKEFDDIPAVLDYLAAAEADLVRNTALFLTPSGDDSEIVKQPVDTSRDPRFRRYMVNVAVANGEELKGAPIYEEDNPSYGNLIGRVEHVAQMGALVTDFLLIKSGALHKANGGYLLIDAHKLLLSPFAYEALKRAVKARQIKIEQPAETMGLISTQTLEPEPIPLNTKVVLFGNRELYYLLTAHDPDFSGLFKVQADFDDTIKRTSDNDAAYARLIASVVARHSLRHMDAAGVARVIDEGARRAQDREKLSIEVGRIADLVRESDYWAGKAKHRLITHEDVTRAVEERVQRADRLRDRAQETFERGIVLVDTESKKIGQINGLSLLQLGEFAFGRPSRITARVRMGAGRVTDIEREAKLGGPLHSKGVMILWGFLAGRFAQDVPLALAASLVFEQSYSGVEGDSASSAELYTLLSALSEVPIKQGLAVTGSVNQWGEVQAIGGVNEKIEGFFDICSQRGLTGKQGVLIPKSNVQHLMLHEDVVEAVREGTFSIYAVATIDEGLEILTGVAAGSRDSKGQFPPGTVNRRVEDKLKNFAQRAKSFSAASSVNAEIERESA